MQMVSNTQWHIFCKIVDNFGDIGVCWRLAQQLQSEHQLTVHLYIDDLSVAKQLIPKLDISLQQQTIQNITTIAWHTNTKFTHAAAVVIESFACELPQAYMAIMQADTAWINLEYLSAETWVDDFHANNAKRGHLTRHFFFPGFTAKTGGLIREHHFVNTHQALANSTPPQTNLFNNLAPMPNAGLKVSLFCYPHAPINTLLSAMAACHQPINCYVPAGNILPIVANFFGQKTLAIGEKITHQNLHLQVIPFLSQSDYDSLLSQCDINFVRGEDSWVRAIWAGKPFIWQPYLQSEQTHIKKLHAFLGLYYEKCDATIKASVINLHNAWLSTKVEHTVWQDYLNNLASLKIYHLQQTNTLLQQPDLATKLVIFSQKILKKIA